jgi:hypothetical protein
MVALLLAAVAATCARAQLHEKFYSESCPSVEDVVRREMVRALSLAPSLAGPLLRMHFHDCFVRVSYICMHVYSTPTASGLITVNVGVRRVCSAGLGEQDSGEGRTAEPDAARLRLRREGEGRRGEGLPRHRLLRRRARPHCQGRGLAGEY